MKRYNKFVDVIINIVLLAVVLSCIIPLILVVSISFTSEAGIVANGYSLIPSEFSIDAYRYIYNSRDSIISAYKITIANTVIGTLLSILVITFYAYPLSREDFKYKKIFTFYVFFTMLFSGGLVSWYIVCTRMLKLSNTIWGMIIPYLMNAWYVIIMRTFFRTTVPVGLIESAKLDGAGEFRTFFKIVLPIAVPGIATIALFQTLAYWNDWWLPLNFVTEQKFYNLQFFLQNLISNIENLTNASENVANIESALSQLPKEGARMALCMVALGPILVVYPFFQKYFIQGLTVGAVKE